MSKKLADFSRLLAIDAILIKASITGTEAVFLNLERRLLQYISNVWTEQAERAIDHAMSAFNRGSGKRVMLADLAAPFKGIEFKMKPAIAAVTRDAYIEGKRQMLMRAHGKLAPLDNRVYKTEPRIVRKAPIKVGIEPDFTLQDEQAIDQMLENQLHWIGDYYDEQLTDQIDSLVTDAMLQTGLGRAEAGKILQERLEGILGAAGASLPEGWAGQAGRYFELIAANVASNARTRGALGQMAEVGVTSYAIVAVGDEKTCDRCAHMDGRVFQVATAVERIKAINAAESPDDIKNLHPWASKLSDMVGKEDGFLFPPYHGECRCTVDIAEDSEITFEPNPAWED